MEDDSQSYVLKFSTGSIPNRSMRAYSKSAEQSLLRQQACSVLAAEPQVMLLAVALMPIYPPPPPRPGTHPTAGWPSSPAQMFLRLLPAKQIFCTGRCAAVRSSSTEGFIWPSGPATFEQRQSAMRSTPAWTQMR